MTAEQVMALLSLLADLKAAVDAQAREIADLRAQIAGTG